MAPDEVSATLAGIRTDIEKTVTVYNLDGAGKNSYPVSAAMSRHARSLVAAVEAVLELHQPGPVAVLGSLCKHHENHRFFSITSTEADDVRACPDCEATVYTSCSGCGHPAPLDACPVREAITAALAGKEAT